MGQARFKPQYRRLLFIDRALRAGQFPNCSRLAREWEVSYKTIRRDLDYMRWELDAPIEYDQNKHGYFYADGTWFLPSLVLSEGDILALLIGAQALAMYQNTPMAEELRTIYGKLAAMLPPEINIPPELIYDRFSFMGGPARRISEETWKGVVRGLTHKRALDLLYNSPRSQQPKPHRVHPYHLTNIEGEWYLIARNTRWEDVAQFALGRIHQVKVTDDAFEIPKDFDPQKILSRRYGKYLEFDQPKKAYSVRLRFSSEVAAFISEREWFAGQKLHNRRDGTLDLSFPSPRLSPLLPWILSFGAHVVVLAPSRLVRLMKHHLSRMNKAYGG